MEKSAHLVWLNYHYHINKISYRDMSKMKEDKNNVDL